MLRRLLDVHEVFADRKEADDDADEVDSCHQRDRSERQPPQPGQRIEPDGGDCQADDQRDHTLDYGLSG